MRGASRIALAAAREHLDAQLAGGPGSARPLAEGLLQVVTLLSQQRALVRSMADPGIEADARRALVDAVFDGKVAADVLGVLRIAVAQRWSSSEDLLDGIEMLGVEAAFSSVDSPAELDDVEDELFRFARIIDGSPELRSALGDSSLPVTVQQDLLRTLIGAKVSPITLLLADSVVAAPRGRPVDRALDALAIAAAGRRDREIAVVITAVPLSDDQRAALAEALGRTLGRGVRLQTQLDPSIVGGVVVRVGDQLFDGSTLHRLADARTRLSR